MIRENTTASLEEAYQDFVKRISSLSTEMFLTSMNGWTPRDVVAHLIGWNSLMIESARSILIGNAPSYYADAPNDYSHINASFTAAYASQSKEELLTELESSMEKFKVFIQTLPAEELTANHGVMHHSGKPATVAKLIHSLASDYQDHTRQITEWFGK